MCAKSYGVCDATTPPLLQAMQSVLENPNPVRHRISSGSRRRSEVARTSAVTEEGVSAVEVRSAPVPGGESLKCHTTCRDGARAELFLLALRSHSNAMQSKLGKLGQREESKHGGAP